MRLRPKRPFGIWKFPKERKCSYTFSFDHCHLTVAQFHGIVVLFDLCAGQIVICNQETKLLEKSAAIFRAPRHLGRKCIFLGYNLGRWLDVSFCGGLFWWVVVVGGSGGFGGWLMESKDERKLVSPHPCLCG